MKYVKKVTSWIDSPRENNFPNFSSASHSRYRGDDPEFSLPANILEKILSHLGVDDYYDTIVLTGFVATAHDDEHYDISIDDMSSSEEIWEAYEYLEPDSVKVLDYNLSIPGFIWGRVCIGVIRIKTDSRSIGHVRVPVYWVQCASPIGFVMSSKYRDILVESFKK